MIDRLRDAGDTAVLSRTIACQIDPIDLYQRVCQTRKDTLVLESADASQNGSLQTVIMVAAALRITARDGQVVVEALSPNGQSVLPDLAARLPGVTCANDGSATTLKIAFARESTPVEADRLRAANVLDVVRKVALGRRVTEGSDSHPPLVLGSLAYDLLASYETLPEAKSDPVGWPDYEMWLGEHVIYLDHQAGRATVVTYVFAGPHVEASYHDASRRLAELLDACKTPTKAASETAAQTTTETTTETTNGRATTAEATEVDVSDDDFAALVVRLKEHIVAGDVFQIVASRTFSRPCPDPLLAYRELRRLNPSPYMFFVSGQAGILFGASPESAFTVDENRNVTICPIAGTRRRGRYPDGSVDDDQDVRIELDLKLDQKEVAEHLMLVDLARNDVARVSVAGSRRVTKLMSVVRYSHVMHLVSLIEGALHPELDALHGYVATMNMGTLVGAPKLRAAELLRHFEPTKRGPYGGAVGYLKSDGTFDSCIVIRSACVIEGVGYVRAGCGVVFDSVPKLETEETLKKAQAVLVAMARAAGGAEL